MRRKSFRRDVLAGGLLGVVALAGVGVSVPAQAVGTGVQRESAPRSAVGAIQQEIARELAMSLNDGSWRAQLRTAVVGGEGDLQALASRSSATGGRRLAAEVVDADRKLREAKGLPGDAGSLLRLRLGTPEMARQLDGATMPWIAVASGNEKAGSVVAFDNRGVAHPLDPMVAPRHPVYVVDVDVAKAQQVGLRVVEQELAAKGVTAPKKAQQAQLGGGFWTSKITAVRVSDDEEPWTKGDAEMFTLVTGFGLDGKPVVNTVTMPYLDTDGKIYRPNQILVNWSTYKYNLADAVMMEDDGDTNYRALAQALTTALLTITDQGAYKPLVDAVIAAIPDSWWTDDPDFVDAWYTLAKNDNGVRQGSRRNGWMGLTPYYVPAF
ncbi:DUF3103 family protein [Kribbella sp. NPDC056861]|uniref:DUF3103 family protein n=1 Tax=Kribbella sp. NPDC056861 TaxID=3154857 RepID=UPI0034418461